MILWFEGRMCEMYPVVHLFRKGMSSLTMYYEYDIHSKMDHFTNLIYQISIFFKEKKLTESSKRRQKLPIFFKEKQEVGSIFQWGDLSDSFHRRKQDEEPASRTTFRGTIFARTWLLSIQAIEMVHRLKQLRM